MSQGMTDRKHDTSSGISILLVEDDQELRCLLKEELDAAGFEVDGVPSAAEALIRMHGKSYGAVVLDKNMPGLNGLDVLPGLRTMRPETPVIMISAFGDATTQGDARRRGAAAFLVKPFRLEALTTLLRQLLGGQFHPEPAGVGTT